MVKTGAPRVSFKLHFIKSMYSFAKACHLVAELHLRSRMESHDVAIIAMAFFYLYAVSKATTVLLL